MPGRTLAYLTLSVLVGYTFIWVGILILSRMAP